MRGPARGQYLDAGGQRDDELEAAGEVPGGLGRDVGDEQGTGGVVPGRRDQLHWIDTEADNEIGGGEQRPLHRAAGE